MKVYITVLKEAGSWNISKITGAYSNKKAAEKAIAIPPGYRPSGLCYESIQEFEVQKEAKKRPTGLASRTGSRNEDAGLV